jgi:signal peptidase
MFDDISIYLPGRSRVMRDEVVGLVRGYIPYLGWITIVLTGYPWVKIMALLALTVVSFSD